jgi:hypothetical protein
MRAAAHRGSRTPVSHGGAGIDAAAPNRPLLLPPPSPTCFLSRQCVASAVALPRREVTAPVSTPRRTSLAVTRSALRSRSRTGVPAHVAPQRSTGAAGSWPGAPGPLRGCFHASDLSSRGWSPPQSWVDEIGRACFRRTLSRSHGVPCAAARTARNSAAEEHVSGIRSVVCQAFSQTSDGRANPACREV